MKLLYAEDEISMSEAVVDILTYHNYMVDAVYDGQTALEYARMEQYDGIILDIMMPGMSGLEVLAELRKEGCRIPILLLTAKAEVEDRIQGLDLGADDYLPKPFVMGELLARVRAMLRRRKEFPPDILKCGNVSLNLHSYELIGEADVRASKFGIPDDGAFDVESGHLFILGGFIGKGLGIRYGRRAGNGLGVYFLSAQTLIGFECQRGN